MNAFIETLEFLKKNNSGYWSDRILSELSICKKLSEINQNAYDTLISQAAQANAAAIAAVSKSTLSLMTPSGRRAYTVMIDSLSAVGGMISPGDFVDIIADVQMPDPSEGGMKEISSIVFQNIQILAVDTNLKASGQYDQQSKARSLKMTFALTPEEAGLMSFLQKHGQMQLLLRAPAEDEIELVEVASWRALADYVAEKQGTELVIPRTKASIEPISTRTTEEVKPFIQIFEGGQAR